MPTRVAGPGLGPHSEEEEDETASEADCGDVGCEEQERSPSHSRLAHSHAEANCCEGRRQRSRDSHTRKRSANVLAGKRVGARQTGRQGDGQVKERRARDSEHLVRDAF